MGNRKSKHKNKSSSSPKEKNNNENQGKIYMNDPVFGRMVYNEIVGVLGFLLQMRICMKNL